ncbi:hypothetical protein VIC_003129 [Vibrio coralliilyticus ATCC BAA-450]|nr:hypothetical protein VIC_003129 [Vibrio coralliilyticus ATCC BAA-450]
MKESTWLRVTSGTSINFTGVTTGVVTSDTALLQPTSVNPIALAIKSFADGLILNADLIMW